MSISKQIHLLTVINHLLEDVAEKPERLSRAMELAQEAVDEAFAKESPEVSLQRALDGLDAVRAAIRSSRDKK